MTELIASLASIFGHKIAERLAERLVRGDELDQVTVDQFLTRSQKRRIGLLLAVERSEAILRNKRDA